jgi:hypothetical protein
VMGRYARRAVIWPSRRSYATAYGSRTFFRYAEERRRAVRVTAARAA